jgi:8-oxo-dGTP pyrophosphatase MutT (NUDIX family)
LHAVAREVKEETGMDVTRVVRKVTEFGWEDYHARRARHEVWTKLIFEVEVKNLDVVLDPIEHQDYVFATEEEVVADQVGAGVSLSWISPTNKEVNLEAFRLRRAEAMPKATGAS